MTTASSLLPRPCTAKTLALLLACSGLLAAIPDGAATGTSAGTTNATPAIGSTYYYTSDPASGSGSTCKATGRATSFDPASGSAATIYVCVEASDANGYEDICDSAATSASEVHRFSVTDWADNSVSDAGHVKANVGLACATGSGTAVALLGSFQMEYWRPWGLSAAGNAYKVVPEVTDVAGAAAASNPGGFGYTNLTSLDGTTTGTISLGGSLAPGATGSEATASIYNKGNVNFTVHLSSSALTGGTRGQTIAAGNLKWASASGVAYASKTAATGSSASTGAAASHESEDATTAVPIYFQLAVPSGSSQWVPGDTWTGTVTFATG